MRVRFGSRLLLIATLVLGLAAAALNKGLGEVPPDVERQTPLDTVQNFLKASHAGDYATAAHYLWLDHLPPAEQRLAGPRLARRLRFVLDHQAWIDLSRVSKSPAGDQEERNWDELGFIPLKKLKIPIRVVRVHTGIEDVWVFDRETVRSIDALYDQYGLPFGDRLPEWLTARSLGDLELWQWIGVALIIVLALAGGLIGEAVLLFLARRFARITKLKWDDELVDVGKGVLRMPLVSAVLAGGARYLMLPPDVRNVVDTVARTLAILALGWISIRFITQGSKVIRHRLEAELTTNPMRARGIETQITVLQRVLIIVSYILTGALLLLQFEAVRSLGVSLLASAGVAGLVLGFAAQKSLAALLAGIQLSITQPIRIGDKVLMENEFGTIEEIRLTYVVVRLWDLRRMVLPINYFLEKPFQNWSKSGTNLIGAVSLQVDFSADVEAFRSEVIRILQNEGRALWDGKTQNIQIIDCTERTQTLRVLVSARDSGDAWDLRCIVREQLIKFLKANPKWLPIQRNMSFQIPAGKGSGTSFEADAAYEKDNGRPDVPG